MKRPQQQYLARIIYLGILALRLGLLACSSFATAQPAKVFRIGWLGFALPANPEVQDLEDAFVEALRAQGFGEGRNVLVERRWTEGRAERPEALAAELVQMKVDVIVAVGSPARRAAKQAPSMKTAKALAITIPPSVLLQADQIIE